MEVLTSVGHAIEDVDWIKVFAFVGFLSLIKFVWSLLRVFFIHLFCRHNPLLKKLSSNASWAVITGASDGIGEAYAKQLAKRGFNVFLISRTLSKLEKIADEIRKLGTVKVEIHELDFSKATPNDYKHIAGLLHSHPVTVLVNNVGLSNDYPEEFLKTDPQRIRDIITVNITASVELTRLIVPEMIEAKRGGLVINVSSALSLAPIPLLGVYAASKSFMSSWSRSLAAELARDKIRVEDQIPFYVASKMSKVRQSLTVPSPDTYVRHALDKVGYVGHYSPYLIHDLTAWFLGLIPEWILIRVFKFMNESIRKKALSRKKQ